MCGIRQSMEQLRKGDKVTLNIEKNGTVYRYVKTTHNGIVLQSHNGKATHYHIRPEWIVKI